MRSKLFSEKMKILTLHIPINVIPLKDAETIRRKSSNKSVLSAVRSKLLHTLLLSIARRKEKKATYFFLEINTKLSGEEKL